MPSTLFHCVFLTQVRLCCLLRACSDHRGPHGVEILPDAIRSRLQERREDRRLVGEAGIESQLTVLDGPWPESPDRSAIFAAQMIGSGHQGELQQKAEQLRQLNARSTFFARALFRTRSAGDAREEFIVFEKLGCLLSEMMREDSDIELEPRGTTRTAAIAAARVWGMTCKMLEGLLHMEDRSFIFQPENIMYVEKESTVQLCFLGVALNTAHWYKPPVRDDPNTAVFGLGVTVAKLVLRFVLPDSRAGTPRSDDSRELTLFASQGLRELSGSHLSSPYFIPLAEVIEKCSNLNPEGRVTGAHALRVLAHQEVSLRVNYAPMILLGGFAALVVYLALTDTSRPKAEALAGAQMNLNNTTPSLPLTPIQPASGRTWGQFLYKVVTFGYGGK